MLTLLHSERPKLYGVLAGLSTLELRMLNTESVQCWESKYWLVAIYVALILYYSAQYFVAGIRC